MRKKNSLYAFIIMLTQAISVPIIAQETTLPEVEKVALFPDRSLYIAGESICFSAFILQQEGKQPLSKILYAELIANDGKSLSRGKYFVDNYQSSGCLEISPDIITGIYFIRAYTKYMRNAGVYAYAYKAVRIVNPYRNEVVPGDEVLQFTSIPGLERHENININDSLNLNLTNAGGELINSLPDIITNKSTYRAGDQVTVSFDHTTANDVSRLSFSVVPAIAATTATPDFKEANREISSLLFFPETRGLTVSGVMRDASDDKLASNKIVNLSIIGAGRDFIPVTTLDDGRYLFPLPYLTGNRDLYIGTSGSSGERYKLLVDNDFCSLPVELPSTRFSLTDEERDIVYQMALNATVKRSFIQEETSQSSISEEQTRAFYGSSTHKLLLNEYVQLPNLEEYFNELPGMIKVRKSNGRKYFKVIGSQLEMVTNEPLVMIDLVAVDNPEKVLAASPSSIARIDMINEPYQKGGVLYGGLISIISKRGDFAGVDLPASGFFINFLFLSDSIAGTKNIASMKNMPDARNTIYSIPELISEDNKSTYSFTAPATPGKYAIILNGVLKDGTLISKTKTLEVKK